MKKAPHPFVIAIDGPSASGKGTLSRRLARHYNFAFLDTGILYRGVALLAQKEKIDIDSENEGELAKLAEKLSQEILTDPALRQETTTQLASRVAKFPALRQALLRWQRDFAENPPDGAGGQAEGAVIDGRDIGTIVCPEADAKLFITAALEIRAKRRCKELQERGESAIYAHVLQDMMARDTRDQDREVAPSRAAPDALVIDTSHLSADDVFDRARAFVDEKRQASD